MMKIELYHDILAQKIFENASAEDQTRLKVEGFIKRRFEHYKSRNALLVKEDLDYINPFLDSILLGAEEKTFIQESLTKIQRDISRKKRWMLAIIVMLSSLLIFSYIQLLRARGSLRSQKNMALSLQASQALNNGDPSLAFRLAVASINEYSDSATFVQTEKTLKEIGESQLHCDLVHNDLITAFEISDTIIATADRHGYLKIWNISCQMIFPVIKHKASVQSLSISRDGQYLLSGADDKKAFFIQLLDGRIDTLYHDTRIIFTAFHNNGSYFLLGDEAGKVSVYDLNLRKIAAASITLNPPLISAEFAPDKPYVMAANEQEVIVNEIKRNASNPLGRFSSAFPFNTINFIQSDFSGDPKLLIRNDSISSVVNLQGFAVVDPFYTALNNYFKRKKTFEFQFGEEDNGRPKLLLISNDPDPELAKWTLGRMDRSTGRVIENPDFIVAMSKPIQWVSFSKNDSLIVMTNVDNEVEIRDGVNGRFRRDFKSKIYSTKFDKSDQYFLSSDHSHVIHLWRLENPTTMIEPKQNIKQLITDYEDRLRPLTLNEINYYGIKRN